MGLDENYRLYAIEYMFGPKSYVYLGLYGELVFFITFSIVGIILLALIYLAKEFRKPKSDLISSTSKIKKERSSIKKNIYNIETENLTKKYTNRFGKSDVLAVDGIDLLVEDGIHGFLGPNGAGKTSTMKMITGAISITKGTAKVKNYKAGTIKAKRIIGFMPQHVSFYEKMTGKQYLYHSARLAGIKKGTAYKLADDLLTRFELQDAANRQIEKYSGGMKQKLGLAASFISSPEILILDEPTSDLDPIWRNKIISYIKQFSEDTSIFVSSHILPEVEEMCDTVTIINNGNIIMTRSMENLKNLYEEGAYRFIIDTTDNQKLLSFLEGKSFIDQVTIDPTSNMIHVLCKDQIRIGQLITRVGDLNIALKKYTQEETSLKNIFLQLINEENSK
jgi:ABC-2 type transport system ATP-binding protein